MALSPAYTVSATATGGRDGHTRTEDGAVDFKLAPPKELGGSGDGANPEQLFAAGYAACFLGAMKFAATKDDSLPKVPDDARVTATVGIGPREDGGGFGLVVKLDVELPDVYADAAEELMRAGHVVCPYSHATQGNIDVILTRKG